LRGEAGFANTTRTKYNDVMFSSGFRQLYETLKLHHSAFSPSLIAHHENSSVDDCNYKSCAAIKFCLPSSQPFSRVSGGNIA